MVCENFSLTNLSLKIIKAVFLDKKELFGDMKYEIVKGGNNLDII